MEFRVPFRLLLIASALLLTAHHLPAPIQEESPTPAPEQSAKSKSVASEPKSKRTESATKEQTESSTPAAIPHAGYQMKTYAATGIIERLDPNLLILERGSEVWRVHRTAITQIYGAPKAGDRASLVYWMVATKGDRNSDTYQLAGSILEIDETKVALRKGNNRWEIACDRNMIRGRVGNNITVSYEMIADSITRIGVNQ